MQTHQASTKQNSIDIGLGYYEDIAGLFSFGEDGPDLVDTITFIFSQTLQRDLYFGSWAQAYRNGNGEYRLKITSPDRDVSAYETLIPRYITAGKLALASYYQNIPAEARQGWEFLLPFGLAMANVQSIQLLHFPPLETFTYKDYLYSPTNRRWECLLAQNGFNGVNNTPLERIVDVAPIAAPGGAGNELSDYNNAFIPYAKAQLENFLQPLASTDYQFTQPIVAYGGPVHDWLKQAFGLAQTPRTLDIVQLSIVAALPGQPAASTWVLCANHPSEYLYDTDIPLSDACKPNGDYPPPINVMCQDLIAAGWQAQMAEHPGDDPHQVLAALEEKWGWDTATGSVKADKVPALLAIMREEDLAFNLDNNSFTPSAAQTAAEAFVLMRDTASTAYASYAFLPQANPAFNAVQMDPHASCPPGNRLMQVGGYLVDWTPAASDDDLIHYRVVAFDRNGSNPLAEKAVTYGSWSKEKFFGSYRSNFGASFSQIELIGLPGYVLSLIPAAGRRSYQLWRFDPQAEYDCLSAGDFSSGGFRDIGADRELYSIGNYVLDRQGANYRVWSFDPQTSPPLALPTIQSGNWHGIDQSDAMTVVGSYVLTWKPQDPSAGCRIWAFDPNNADPLGGNPINTTSLPEGFTAASTLFGAIPSQPARQALEHTPGTIEFMRNKIQHV
ncbi:MAG: hypothetical protein ACK4VV_16995, partial [Pseudomonas sp.]